MSAPLILLLMTFLFLLFVRFLPAISMSDRTIVFSASSMTSRKRRERSNMRRRRSSPASPRTSMNRERAVPIPYQPVIM